MPSYEEEREKLNQFNKGLRLYLSERQADDFRQVCATPQGRRIIWWIMELCGLYRFSNTCDNFTFFQEGQRSIGVALKNQIDKASPTLLQQIYREITAEAISNESKRDKVKSGEFVE
jgi:hypothetical protein